MAQQAGHVLVVCNVINTIFSLYDYLYNNSTAAAEVEVCEKKDSTIL